MPFRITIAGDIGSGKSTVAKKLADWLGVEPHSTGGIQRQLAQQRGLSVLELSTSLPKTTPVSTGKSTVTLCVFRRASSLWNRAWPGILFPIP